MILQFLRFLRFYNFKSISYTTLRFTPKWFSDSTDSMIVGRQIFIYALWKKKQNKTLCWYQRCIQRCIQSASLCPGKHSFFFWMHRILNKGSNWMQKKIECFCKLQTPGKTASHDMQICVLWKQFLSTDWLFTVYFAANFQTKVEKPLCFLITFLSR